MPERLQVNDAVAERGGVGRGGHRVPRRRGIAQEEFVQVAGSSAQVAGSVASRSALAQVAGSRQQRRASAGVAE